MMMTQSIYLLQIRKGALYPSSIVSIADLVVDSSFQNMALSCRVGELYSHLILSILIAMHHERDPFILLFLVPFMMMTSFSVYLA